MTVRLELNNAGFQRNLFSLERAEQVALLKACAKLARLTWQQVYQDKGLRWQAIRSEDAYDGGPVFSIRVTGKMRALVRREGPYLEFLNLHADHDSAYD